MILPERKQICGAAARGRDRGEVGTGPWGLNPDSDPEPDPEDSGPGATATRGVSVGVVPSFAQLHIVYGRAYIGGFQLIRRKERDGRPGGDVAVQVFMVR